MDVKIQILKKAEDLFLRYGLKSVTMDDIARDLGISKKTLYQFVNNKSDLLKQIMVNEIEKENEAMIQIKEESKDAIDEMLKMAKYVLTRLRSYPPTIMYDLQKYYRDIWQMIENHHRTYIYTIIKLNIEKGMEQELYRDNLNPDIIAKLYVSKTIIVADEDMFPLQQYNKEDLFKEYMVYHIHGIASKKGLKLLEKHT